ncbi:hypothetical protein IGI37_000225 [Enterococcus sp. AZ194]|uniref:helix-turn-helix domain-containing protein n=1 Tax=Enterococcus sp. AZ194 TaxID=2774629 RepID=UPI003F20D4CC
MDKLLNRNDITKLQILYYILSGNNMYRAIEEIELALDLSYYIVKSCIKELTNDLKEIYAEEERCRIERCGEGYRVAGDAKNVIAMLVWRYGGSSKVFQFLDAILNKKDFSLLKYSRENYLSTSSAYNAKKNLESFFSYYNIRLDGNYKIRGNEFSIRQLLFSVYFTIFNEFENPFSNFVTIESEHLMAHILNDYTLNALAEGDKNKLYFFLYITTIRLDTGETLSQDNHYFFPQTERTETSQFLQKRFNLSEESAAIECQSIKFFLETEKILPYSTSVFKNEVVQSIVEQADAFISFLEKYSIEFKSKYSMNIANHGLRDIFKNILLCSMLRIDNLFYLRHEDVCLHYPTQFVICKSFMEKYFFERADLGAALSRNNSLMLSVVFAVTTLFEFSHLQYEVKVKLDFNLGISYQREIQNLMTHMIDLPITIVVEKNLEADIVVTDRYKSNHTENRIIDWSYPPTVSDWQRLSNKISELLFQN